MAASLLPQKRVFGEASNARRNIDTTPASMKKRKLEAMSSPAARFKSSQNGPRGKVGSSQPSHFESEVLEKLTQDMSGLKNKNSEKDQQWSRPSLADFNTQTDNLIFQQIEVEEGTLHGGKATVKLFGVTEVSRVGAGPWKASNGITDWPFGHASRHGFSTLPIRCRACLVWKK
jgi:DNA polymerase delta subunit 1